MKIEPYKYEDKQKLWELWVAKDGNSPADVITLSANFARFIINREKEKRKAAVEWLKKELLESIPSYYNKDTGLYSYNVLMKMINEAFADVVGTTKSQTEQKVVPSEEKK